MRGMKLSTGGKGTKSNKHEWYPPPLCFCINCHLEREGPQTHSSHLPFPYRQRLGGGGGRIGVRGKATMPSHLWLVGWPTVTEGEGWGWGDEGWGWGEVLPCPNATWSWRGKTSILGFEIERERERLHNLWLYSNSDNEGCGRMRRMKINATWEGA